MKIEKNTVVSVTYQLFAGVGSEEKKFIETADNDHPFVFLFGTGNLIEGFENHIKGLGVGDSFDFEIGAAEAYGPIDKEAIVNLPIDIFKQNGQVDRELLTVGNMVPMSDEEGHRLTGKVVEVKDTEVVMDFNHPLAGHNLRFSGEVIDLRPATSEEIDHGHVHEGGQHHH